MRKFIETIPHDKQEYNTAGNYVTDRLGMQHFTISDMGNEDYEMMIAIHELIEEHLTRMRGISEEAISEFDMTHSESDDPGNLPDAPYRKEHTFAESIERLLCKEMGYNWERYEYSFNKLQYKKDLP